MSKQSQGGGEEPGHQDRNAPRWSVSREEVQEAGSPFNLAPLGGRRNGSNTNRCRLRNFFFFIHRCPPPKGLNHACAHVLEENRSRIRCTLAVDPSPPLPPPNFRSLESVEYEILLLGKLEIRMVDRWESGYYSGDRFFERSKKLDALDLRWFEQDGGFLMRME